MQLFGKVKYLAIGVIQRITQRAIQLVCGKVVKHKSRKLNGTYTTGRKPIFFGENSNYIKGEVKSATPAAAMKSRKKQSISKALRWAVWEQWVGQSWSGLCACCSQTIDVKNFVSAHVQAEAKGGATAVHNLRPTCANCNLSMGTRHMLEFMQTNGFIVRQEVKLESDKGASGHTVIGEEKSLAKGQGQQGCGRCSVL